MILQESSPQNSRIVTVTIALHEYKVPGDFYSQTNWI